MQAELNNIEAANKAKRDFAMDNLKLLQQFSGNKAELPLYVESIEAIIPHTLSLSTGEKRLFFNAVLRTLRGPALDLVRREQPTDWKTLKGNLLFEFGEHIPISTLIISFEKIRFKNNRQLFDDVNNLLCRIKDAVKLNIEDENEKTFFLNEADSSAVRVLKKQFPNHITALLNANQVKNISDIIKVLRENDIFNEIPMRKNNYAYAPNAQNYNFSYGQPLQNYVNEPNIRPNFSSQGYAQQNNNLPQNASQSMPHPNNNFSQNDARNRLHPNNFSQNSSNRFPYQQQAQIANVPFGQNVYQNNPAQPPFKRKREYDSNQSRIRRYGPPKPMEVDEGNFLLAASDETYPVYN